MKIPRKPINQLWDQRSPGPKSQRVDSEGFLTDFLLGSSGSPGDRVFSWDRRQCQQSCQRLAGNEIPRETPRLRRSPGEKTLVTHLGVTPGIQLLGSWSWDFLSCNFMTSNSKTIKLHDKSQEEPKVGERVTPWAGPLKTCHTRHSLRTGGSV